jgi:hypothetical protein
MARDDIRKSRALHGFWISDPILTIGKVENPSEFPPEFKCRKAKAASRVSLSLFPLAAPTQHA